MEGSRGGSEQGTLRSGEDGRLEAIQVWRRCSSCKQEIACGATYWTCSVSTCNRKRTALAFCTVSCWDAHLPVARHRESWAEEQKAPREPEASAKPEARAAVPTSANESQPSDAPRRRRIVRPDAPKSDGIPREVLIVTSRLKDYVRARAGFSTSDRVLGPLSEIVRKVCDEAIANASREGRKTILDRDIPDL